MHTRVLFVVGVEQLNNPFNLQDCLNSFYDLRNLFFFRWKTSRETPKYFPLFRGWYPVQTRFAQVEVLHIVAHRYASDET